MRARPRVLLGALALGLLAAPPASASFVGRPLTLPSGRWEVGLGAGLGRKPGVLGVGFNLELGVGVTSSLELRLRTGLRPGHNARATGADAYGRPFETETYNLGGDTVANPEVGLLWDLARGRAAALAFDGRVILPMSGDIAVLLGLPIRLHLGRARIDTGIMVPISFERETTAIVSLPLHLFFAVGGGLALGPITGVRFHDHGGTAVPLGFGIASALSSDADLRFWLLFPDVSGSGSAKTFGGGVGLNIFF